MMSPKKVFLFYFLIIYGFKLTSAVEFNSLTYYVNVEDSTAACVSQILEKHYSCNDMLTIIVRNTAEITGLFEIISGKQCYSCTVRTYHMNDWWIYNGVYLIITETAREVKIVISEIKLETFWNPRARFIISTQKCTDDDINDIFLLLMTYKVYDVTYLVKLKEDTYVFTYFPFDDGKCANDAFPLNVGICENVVNNTNYFQKRVITNYSNCNFKVVKYVEKSGAPIVEQFVLDSFASSSNLTLTYEDIEDEKNFGVVLPNGTTTGLLGYLQRNQADVAMGSTVLIKNRVNLYDFICGFNFASFNLYSAADEDEMWKTVYEEFDTKTWFLILLNYCLIVVVCIKLFNISPKTPYNRVHLVVNLYGFFLGNGAERFSRKRRIRAVMIFWIWFTFLLTNFYQSDMYGLITSRTKIKRQISHEKLTTIPYKPCMSEVIRTFFYFAYNEVLPESVNIPACNTIDGALETVSARNDLYTVQIKSSYTSREKEFLDAHGHRKLDSWEFSSAIALSFYLYKGFVLKDQLQIHAHHMFEAGLVDIFKNWDSPPQTLDNRKKKAFKQFVLGDFRIHFAVLFVGSIISTTAFVVELFGKKYPHKIGHYVAKLS